MKHLRFLVLSVFLPLLISCGSREISLRLKDLDNLLLQREKIHAGMKADISVLRESLKSAETVEEEWNINKSIFERYNVFNYDSAAVYLSRMESIARQTNDREKMISCKTYASFLLFKKGNTEETLKRLEAIDCRGLKPCSALSVYLTTCAKVYSDISKYSDNQELREYCRERYLECRKEYLKNFHKGFHVSKFNATILEEEGRYEEALAIFMDLFNTSAHILNKANAAYHISGLYGSMGDDRNKILWMIKAASCDIQAPTLNYAALYHLALFMNDIKDIDRAVKYINISFLDAIDIGYMARIMESGSASIDIDHAFNQIQQRKRTNLTMCIIALALLVVSLMFTYRIRVKYSRRLRRAYRKLDRANMQLSESNKIKESYLFKYMILSTDYLEKAEDLRHRLVKTFKSGGTEALMKELRRPGDKWTELKSFFKIFDDTFLGICPNFVGRVNLLLKEECRFEESKTLPTELRVFAVIRLGMSESGEIAKFLGCAPQTVYSYRNRLRNAALDRDNFEQAIMAIPL